MLGTLRPARNGTGVDDAIEDYISRLNPQTWVSRWPPLGQQDGPAHTALAERASVVLEWCKWLGAGAELDGVPPDEKLRQWISDQRKPKALSNALGSLRSLLAWTLQTQD